MASRIIFEPPVPLPLILGIAAALTLATVVSYMKTANQVHRVRRFLLASIRLAFLAGLLLVLMRPMEFVPEAAIQTKPVFHVLLDSSQSMNTKDAGEKSRFSAMREAIADNETVFSNALAEKYDVRFYRFDRNLSRTSLDDEISRIKASGEKTHLASCLQETMQISQGIPQAGILLFTDGRDNENETGGNIRGVARHLRAQNIPVWTVPIGTSAETKDIYVTAHLSSNFLFVNQPGSINVSVSGTGYSNWYARVHLFREDQYLSSQQVHLRQGGAKVSFPVTEERKGTYQYRVEVEPLAGERDLRNNHRSLFARVINERTKVLLVEAKLSWDSKFLLRILREDYNIDVTSIFYINPRKTFAIVEKVSQDNSLSKEATPGVRLPKTREELFKYDCIFLGKDIDTTFTTKELKLLRDYLVERGGNLVFFRGKSYSGENPVLAHLEPIEWDSQLLQNTRFELTKEGRRSPIFNFQLYAQQTDFIIRELPEMTSITKVRNEKSHAVILAHHEDKEGTHVRPVAAIAYQRYGKGKVMSIGTNGLWRWAFLPEDLERFDDIYRRFWSQMIRWLVADSDFLPGQDISFLIDKNTYIPGQTVRFCVRTKFIDSAEYRPWIELIQPDGTKNRLSLEIDQDGKNVYTAFYIPRQEGEYKAILHNNIGEPRDFMVRFTAYQEFLELRYVAADREALEQLSETTRGETLDAEDLEELPAKIQRFEQLTSEKVKPQDIWDRLLFFCILTALLGVEWLARRLSGLT